ncbi:MAG: Mut7-C RNAse domain-containing protein [Dehalococcoidales bacterium]
MKFFVDHNVGKLVKWLRMMGYDTLFFTGDDDWQMVITALNEGRIILTRDTQIMNRGVIASGRLKAILIRSDEPEKQIKQVTGELELDTTQNLFSLCLECNQPLEERTSEQVEGRVPAHVFRTLDRYMECPSCHRIYWKGTHWQAMNRTLEKLRQG